MPIQSAPAVSAPADRTELEFGAPATGIGSYSG